MSEYQITCVVKDQGVITHVGIVGVTYPVMEVVNWILSKQHTFFTNKNGYKAGVYAKQSEYGRWFLTTEPDSTRANNLDFLTPCM